MENLIFPSFASQTHLPRINWLYCSYLLIIQARPLNLSTFLLPSSFSSSSSPPFISIWSGSLVRSEERRVRSRGRWYCRWQKSETNRHCLSAMIDVYWRESTLFRGQRRIKSPSVIHLLPKKLAYKLLQCCCLQILILFSKKWSNFRNSARNVDQILWC